MAPPALTKSTSTSSSHGQKSILGFFQRGAPAPAKTKTSPRKAATRSSPRKQSVQKRAETTSSLTPAPSSDAISPEDNDDEVEEEVCLPKKKKGRLSQRTGLPSPVTPGMLDGASDGPEGLVFTSSPSRKAKRQVNYADPPTEDDEDGQGGTATSASSGSSQRRRLKRRKASDDSDEGYSEAPQPESEDDLDNEDDFVVSDASEDDFPTRKRKRTAAKASSPRPSPIAPSDEDGDLAMPAVSTATQWSYDPEEVQPLQPRPLNLPTRKPQGPGRKQKAHTTEPEHRYPWLANITDADRNSPDSPDYDPRTIYVPPMAWANFSPFEKQYWEIKKNLWDTIVFFKKGKFYELYENDATIGHQLFDLKLTDRVNMRMVGVPEMSLDHWANQFVAKGFKIARVDQKETALGKEMRERDGQSAKKAKEDKVIRRELACVLTGGTLVEGRMLQDDMATYCVAIKEALIDERPAFGVAFVDAATGQFHLTQFSDDADYTKFETFVAQTRPQELLLEKGNLSTRSLRILTNNTGPTTIWNNLKPDKEFWAAEITRREIDACRYFADDEDQEHQWPSVLAEAKDKDLVMSALGGLIYYLRALKIERELMTLANFAWYEPLRKATSLVLDGQTLINLEVFANSFDGGVDGTLFLLLNRCITPFGKRMFKQWVCHPLADSERINARLDAVDALNLDPATRDQFVASMTKMPDLERLISRVHAGSCKVQDFVRVLEGFEQIEYTMSLLDTFGAGDSLLGRLITSMPDLRGVLAHWKTAFDRSKAKEHGLLIPEPGVETDFDESQDRIESIHGELNALLKKVRRDLGSSAIVFRDNGKEIFQLEVPIKVKGVPSNWDQMSATKVVKRYYSPELRTLVRQLQEAQESHSQIVKEVASRFFARFDEDYVTWLSAVKIVAQLDCLISLAKASSSLGTPSCRPVFVEDERSVLELQELRHPCMLDNVTDFIPNDIQLGGQGANITMLTGANAAGKSTILRMTCIAVIMAQIGCYVPASYARLTPVDRIMSRLGANDHIFAAQSTFFVELAETKKILSEATPRSLVILDELGRGTSSYDGVAVAHAVLHHVATHVGCIGFFATHYRSLADEFASHPEICNRRMQIYVDDAERRITFLYKLEEGVAEGSFGMHCAAMCGIPGKVIERAEVAAREWEHTSRLKESLEAAQQSRWVPLGWQSDVSWILKQAAGSSDGQISLQGLQVLQQAISQL